MRKLWTTPFDVMPIILAVLCVGSVTQISIASFAAEAASASESSLQQTIEARPDLSMGGVSKPPERPLFDAAAPVPVWSPLPPNWLYGDDRVEGVRDPYVVQSPYVGQASRAGRVVSLSVITSLSNVSLPEDGAVLSVYGLSQDLDYWENQRLRRLDPSLLWREMRLRPKYFGMEILYRY